MITSPTSIRIWGSQLAHNDFPPVCAMTGRPAETWRKFSFSTPPAWTYALLVLLLLGLLGAIVAVIISGAVSVRATGHLPLTRASRRVADVVTWIPNALILGSIALMTGVVVAAFAGVDAGDPNAGTVAGLALLIAIFALAVGLVVRLFVAPFVLPKARVEALPGTLERALELRNVSPAFVQAANRMYMDRSVQKPEST